MDFTRIWRPKSELLAKARMRTWELYPIEDFASADYCVVAIEGFYRLFVRVHNGVLASLGQRGVPAVASLAAIADSSDYLIKEA